MITYVNNCSYWHHWWKKQGVCLGFFFFWFFCFLLCLKRQRLFSDLSLSSSDFSLKQRNVPLLRRPRGWGCSTKKTTQTISTSLGDARAINRTRATADLRWSNSSSRSRACIKWTRVWPGWLAQGKWSSITIQTEQVMTLWYSFRFFSLFFFS